MAVEKITSLVLGFIELHFLAMEIVLDIQYSALEYLFLNKNLHLFTCVSLHCLCEQVIVDVCPTTETKSRSWAVERNNSTVAEVVFC